MSPVGARCRECAPVVRAPMYNVSGVHIAKAAGVAIGGGVLMGFIWGFIGIAISYGFFLIFIGAGLGYAFTRMMEWATRGKRGPVIIAFAIGGILIAWGMLFLFVPVGVAQIQLVAVAVGSYLAYQSLK